MTRWHATSRKGPTSPCRRCSIRSGRRVGGKLAPEIVLEFDDPALGQKTVADVLVDPDRYLGETLADPLEGVPYGRCKAKVMRKNGGGVFIHTFAHGGGVHRLMIDAPRFDAIIENTDAKDVVAAVAAAFQDAMLDAHSEDRVRRDCATKANVGVKVVNNAIREEARRRAEIEEDMRLAQEEQARLEDTRVLVPLPPPDAEVWATVQPIDQILSRVNTPELPMRNLAGQLVCIEERVVDGLHGLTKGDDTEGAGEFLPAPPMPLITPLDQNGIAMVVEEHILIVSNARPKNGESEKNVRLPWNFCNALNVLKKSAIPVVTGVQSIPLVLLDRRLMATNGYHARLRLMFKIEQTLLPMLPRPEDCTVAKATADYRWLCDVWLADVETTPRERQT